MKKNKINFERNKALISLLDDPNDMIYNSVKTEILALSKAEILNSDFKIIPQLQNAFHMTDDELKLERLAKILDHVKLEKLSFDIEDWKKGEEPNLIDGMLHIARFGYPNFDTKVITTLIEEMVASVKSKITGKSPQEITAILNQVILYDFGFNGNYKEYSALNNSFINKVFETKASNPIGLSVLYLLIANETGIPLVGINSPGHFILGYLVKDTNDKVRSTDKIAFFIDPFNKGKIIKSDDFNRWLKLQDMPQKVMDTLIATEKAVVKRVFNNLIYALYTSGEKTTAEKLLVVAEAIE